MGGTRPGPAAARSIIRAKPAVVNGGVPSSLIKDGGWGRALTLKPARRPGLIVSQWSNRRERAPRFTAEAADDNVQSGPGLSSPACLVDRGVGRQEYPVRPKIAMWSDYGSPTKMRWRSRYRRGTRSWTGLKILLVAAACVAGVIGISGIYPQIINSQWARGTSAHSQGVTHSETAPETVGMMPAPQAPPGLGGSRNSSATVRKRRRCPAFARCKASFNLRLAASSLPFFERQSKQVKHPSGFAFASNLTHAKPPSPCAPN